MPAANISDAASAAPVVLGVHLSAQAILNEMFAWSETFIKA